MREGMDFVAGRWGGEVGGWECNLGDRVIGPARGFGKRGRKKKFSGIVERSSMCGGHGRPLVL